MKNVSLALAGTILLASGSAVLAAGDLGEFSNNRPFGLTQGVKKFTDCSVQEKIDGKLYCFSKQFAKEEFMKDPEAILPRPRRSTTTTSKAALFST